MMRELSDDERIVGSIHCLFDENGSGGIQFSVILLCRGRLNWG